MQCISKPILTKALFKGKEYDPLIADYEFTVTTGFKASPDIKINDCHNSLELLSFYYLISLKKDTLKEWLDQTFKTDKSIWFLFEKDSIEHVMRDIKNGEIIVEFLRGQIHKLFSEDEDIRDYIIKKYYSSHEDEFKSLMENLKGSATFDQSLIIMEGLSFLTGLKFTVHTTHENTLQQINIAPNKASIDIIMYYQVSLNRYYLLYKKEEDILIKIL